MKNWYRVFTRQSAPYTCLMSFVFFLCCNTVAQAAITVTDAKIANGRLIVTGLSDLGDTVSLDGYYTAEVSNRVFTFNLIYVPASCIVSLGAPGTTAPNTRAVVANCAPMPFHPAGEWQNNTVYKPNDLVERNGATYVALSNARTNLNEDPLVATSFWRSLPIQNNIAERTLLIGPKGERGETGRDGLKGDRGEDGAFATHSLQTIKADITRPITENGQAKGEWRVTSRGTITVTISRGERENEAELQIPASALTDIEHCSVTATFFNGNLDRDMARLGLIKKRGDFIVLPLQIPSEMAHLDAVVLCPKAK